MFKPCCKRLFERLAAHFELSLEELLAIADPKPVIKVNPVKCLAKIYKDKTLLQCTRPRKKGDCLCDIHLKKAAVEGLSHGMLQDIDGAVAGGAGGADGVNRPIKLSDDPDKGIEVRLMMYQGVEYFYDYKTSRIYDTETHKLVGIMTEKNVLEFDKAYLI